MKSFMILGGTPTAVKVAKRLEKLGVSSIRLLESDAARCEQIASELDYTMVLKSETVDEDLLRSEGVRETDAFLALTDDDEENALTAPAGKAHGSRSSGGASPISWDITVWSPPSGSMWR